MDPRTVKLIANSLNLGEIVRVRRGNTFLVARSAGSPGNPWFIVDYINRTAGYHGRPVTPSSTPYLSHVLTSIQRFRAAPGPPASIAKLPLGSIIWFPIQS